MGAIAGHFLYYPRNNSSSKTICGLALAGTWMAISYYLYEVGFLGVNAIANLPNLLINFVQAAVGIVIYLPISKAILRSKSNNK